MNSGEENARGVGQAGSLEETLQAVGSRRKRLRFQWCAGLVLAGLAVVWVMMSLVRFTGDSGAPGLAEESGAAGPSKPTGVQEPPRDEEAAISDQVIEELSVLLFP